MIALVDVAGKTNQDSLWITQIVPQMGFAKLETLISWRVEGVQTQNLWTAIVRVIVKV